MDRTDQNGTDQPWPQRLLDNIWLLAAAAILFWALSYLLWGYIDIVTAGVN